MKLGNIEITFDPCEKLSIMVLHASGIPTYYNNSKELLRLKRGLDKGFWNYFVDCTKTPYAKEYINKYPVIKKIYVSTYNNRHEKL